MLWILLNCSTSLVLKSTETLQWENVWDDAREDVETDLRNSHQVHWDTIGKCEECALEDKDEENVLNHTIAEHSNITCNMCDFQTRTEEDLIQHESEIHRKTRYTCEKCSSYFNTMPKLKEHKTSKHQEQVFPCDHCKFKANSIHALDKHIESYHRIKSGKNVDMWNVEGRDPCNFTDPSHSNQCCDREPGQPRTFFTPKERLQNGACRNWNESICTFSDLCRFAHITVCSYQEHCRNPLRCNFFHFDRSNIDFLGGETYQHSFLRNSSLRRWKQNVERENLK